MSKDYSSNDSSSEEFAPVDPVADDFPPVTSVEQTLVPMKALYERIDHVRRSRNDLPNHLRNIASEIPSPWTRKTLRKLADAFDENASAAQIVAKFPEHCWLLTLQSTTATTDALTAMLEQSAYQHHLKAKKIRTIAYPVVLLTIAFGLIVAALALLIPSFDEMYQEFGLMLPSPTNALIWASRLVSNSPLLVVAIAVIFLVGLSALLWLWIGEGPAKRKLLGITISTPSLRQSLAKVSLQIAELCDDGLPLAHALKITAESTSNSIVRSLLGDLAMRVATDPSSVPHARAAMILPPNFLFALNPTEAGAGMAPPNSTMLRELAASYRELSIRRNDWISFLIAQFCVIGVGLMIGYIVIALFLPMVSLVTSLAG